MNILQNITWLFYQAFTWLAARVPFVVLYGLSNAMAFILRNILRYRRRVVRNNIVMSFPTWNLGQVKKLEKQLYLNLTDVVLETMKIPAMSHDTIAGRFTLKPNPALRGYCESKQSLVIVSAHFGNWEWGACAVPEMVEPLESVGFYKPIKNKKIDASEKEIRALGGTQIVSMFNTTKTFNQRRKIATAFFMIADQSPSDQGTAIWNKFLNQPTAWLHGPEKHSTRLGYPVFLFIPIRRSRGHYEVETTLLTDDPSKLKPGELTGLYATALEKYITQYPEQWIWTHRRWKLKPTNSKLFATA
ncbi:MAG: lysophospholipid acyltransferase family protein [Bacteroidales bacterium]|nr:lysophospholipid acyltransferase family protein [Bacteroidales bacterium]